MMNADCLRCDRLIRLQWDGAFTRGQRHATLSLRGTEGEREKKGRREERKKVWTTKEEENKVGK